eukprot:scaffold259_cov252-Pinguiococcus_pyrenoidosus.AAC.17
MRLLRRVELPRLHRALHFLRVSVNSHVVPVLGEPPVFQVNARGADQVVSEPKSDAASSRAKTVRVQHVDPDRRDARHADLEVDPLEELRFERVGLGLVPEIDDVVSPANAQIRIRASACVARVEPHRLQDVEVHMNRPVLG